MSIDLDWGKLDNSLATSLIELLNRQLKSTPRPSFIGPVEVAAFEFGSRAPDVELVDLRDIYRDFLEDNESESGGEPVKATEGAGVEDDDGFEWVSRRAATREDALGYQHLPPHVRYGPRTAGATTDMFSSVPSLRSSPDLWNGGMSSLPSLGPSMGPVYSGYSPIYRSPLSAPPFHAFQRLSTNREPSPSISSVSTKDPSPPNPSPASPALPEPATNAQPNLQLHLHIHWPSDLRLTLTTSLLINYPTPLFMSLPIKLCVTGLVFTGEVAVAYEGARKRMHLCILDDLDPYGPAAGAPRPRRDSADITPPDAYPESAVDAPLGASYPRTAKPLPVGQRLLPSILIETEIGQTDKHVLKNVTRVERFIQDVIRKTVEEELVFPNFHTLLMGDPEPDPDP
ncbi:unnamed protein product [Mycena citricolor]|uniref:Mitochondrial distribution and morphology protein 12 n=1 Tax=Mycena citricolor TaxID=2018698 RepID=A0AAD2K3Q6_9AGAR|nr:unnamed protein product [Mycena citricolor]